MNANELTARQIAAYGRGQDAGYRAPKLYRFTLSMLNGVGETVVKHRTAETEVEAIAVMERKGFSQVRVNGWFAL